MQEVLSFIPCIFKKEKKERLGKKKGEAGREGGRGSEYHGREGMERWVTESMCAVCQNITTSSQK